SLATQWSKTYHLGARHACLPQADQEVDPGKIVLSIAPIALRSPANWLKQPYTLIIAQCIDAQPRLWRHLLCSQSCFHTTNINPGVHSRSRVCLHKPS